jgi:sugar lactone lactonase YvrE
VITTVAGSGSTGSFGGGFGGDNGAATTAKLNSPLGVAVDVAGNCYIADTYNHRVRKVSNGVITTVAGNGTGGFGGDNGPASSAELNPPLGVAVDSAGTLYIADSYNNRVRKVSNGVITTVAGTGTQGDNGQATTALLNRPEGVAVDSAGSLYIADTGNNRIRKVANGVITTVAGTGTPGFNGDYGPATSAQLNYPYGIAVDSVGNIYIADTGNNRIRKVANGVITTVAGNGTGGFSGDNGQATSAQLAAPYSVAVDTAGNLYIADNGNNRVREVSHGVITTVAGNGTPGYGGDNGPATSAQLYGDYGVAVDSAGNLYIAGSVYEGIREVSNGVITTVVGGPAGFGGDGGPATLARLFLPRVVAVDSFGNLYFADSGNARIRKVSNGVITTVAGNGTSGFGGDSGPATSAQLSNPWGVTVDAAGNVYIADTSNDRIRVLTPSGPSCSASLTPLAFSAL